MALPIGFFMPLPLPIMIPFMMWQSAAIAAGFGTYFQFAKRRVSAMSNEEFNKADPHELVNSMYEDIVRQIPSSFAKVDSLTPVMLQSMNVMLDQAVKWLSGAITGNIFGTPNPVNDGLDTTDPALPDPTVDLLSFTQEFILNMPESQLRFHLSSNQNLYDATTWSLLEQELERRQRTGVDDPILNTDCPTGQVWDPVSQKCIPIVETSTIPWMSLENCKIQAIGRVTREGSGGTRWFLATNPQRNGTWQKKATYTADFQAINAGIANWSSTDHNRYGFKEFYTTTDQYYWVRKSDITIKNFPHP